MNGAIGQRALSWLADIAANIVAPALVFAVLQPRMGDVPALLVASVPPLLWGIGTLVQTRRIDALSVLALAGIALSLLAFAGGGSAVALQLREKLVTLVIALAFLGSAAIGRPLIGPLARATVAREGAEAVARMAAVQHSAAFKRSIMVMTLVWGFGLLADFAVSVALIRVLTIGQYLIVGPVVGYATMGSLALWTVVYRRRMRR